MNYRECKYYEGGYCLQRKNSFGINETCCERNDCPELYSQRKETAWKENYIKFTDNGKRYEQFDGEDANTPCKDCVFSGKHCQHPHYYDGSKGYCGKPYREVKEK